jgi:hypothetical protein
VIAETPILNSLPSDVQKEIEEVRRSCRELGPARAPALGEDAPFNDLMPIDWRGWALHIVVAKNRVAVVTCPQHANIVSR